MRGVAAVLGLALWGAALVLVLLGVTAETTFEGMANQLAMQRQQLFIGLGIGAAVAGSVFLSASMIIANLRDSVDRFYDGPTD